MTPPEPMRPSTSMRLPLTCMTATARFCPCLLASSSSRTSFSRCSIILRCLSISQKKSHRVPSQSRDGGCDQRASRFASSLWPVNGKRGFKTTRGLHRKTEPASNAACCAWCRSDHHLLPSGHLNSVNFHRVTLHCVFEVSPLEIGGFGAVPPSPPLMQAQVVHTTWAFCIGANFLVECYRAHLRSHRCLHRQILPPRRSSTHASVKPWQPCLKMVG